MDRVDRQQRVFLWILLCCTGSLYALDCSKGCPPGHYEAKPCTHFGDRLCKPFTTQTNGQSDRTCRKCLGSMYESKPCSAKADRECIHAAHPLLISDDETTPTFLDGLKVDASPNVIVEDLHNTRNLETTFYVTAKTQASDFPWERESGINVNIGILNVHLVPEYVDVDHESENAYMVNNPNQADDKINFNSIVQNQCRNPIPDSYIITLEIARDRTTSARMVECSNRNPALPNCSKGHVDGDIILERDLNRACQQMGTFPEELEVHKNSIVCTKSDGLLKDIFRQSSAVEHPITIPDKKCRLARLRCDQCFSHSSCDRADIFESQCCKVDCYTLADCKVAQSAECKRFPVECAMGDAYRYTLQPVYENINREFNCHLKHKKPRILYELFFFLEIPGRYQTPKVYKTVYAGELDYQSHGQFQADYLTVEHDIGLSLADEFILTGRELTTPQKANYSVAVLKSEEDYARQGQQPITVYDVEHNIYIASTQFARPFDYSSATWTVNNECDKDISKFKPAQKHYKEETSQKVAVTMETQSSPFKYWLQPEETPAFIRFTVPGNTSVLPWYFDENGPELNVDNSLEVKLELQPGDKVWNIHVRGRMTDCPAYLGVTINTRDNLEELIRQDLLILCPTTFNLTFHAPNIGGLPSKTFDVLFKDARKTYQIFLTQLYVGEKLESLVPKPVKTTIKREISYRTLLVIICCVVAVTLLLKKLYIYVEVLNIKRVFAHSKQREIDTAPKASADCNMSQRRVAFLVIYIVLRIFYSLIFTFTAFFGLLMIFVRPDLNHLANMDEYVNNAQNQTHAMSRSFDKHWREELLREAELVTDIQGACSFYVSELFDSMTFQMNNITSHYHQRHLFGEESSLSYLMHQRFAAKLQHYSDDLDTFTQDYRDAFESHTIPPMKKYKDFLKDIYHNPWLTFTQKLFNDSSFKANERSATIGGERSATIGGDLFEGLEVDFGMFLELHEIEELRLLQIQLWESYKRDLPSLPHLPVPELRLEKPHCTFRRSTERYNITQQPLVQHLNSERYYAPHLPLDADKGPTYQYDNTVEEYKFVTEGTIPLLRESNVKQAAEELKLSNMVDMDMLWLIFLGLDVLLLLYRLSHTYTNASDLCKENTYYTKSERPSTHATENQYYTSPGVAMDTTTKLREASPNEYAIPLGAQKINCYPNHYGNHNSNGARYNQTHSGQQHTGVTSLKERNNVSLYYSNQKDSILMAVFNTGFKIILSETLPKVLIGCTVLFLCYIAMATTHFFTHIDVVIDLDFINIYVSGLKSQINQTNWYLSDQANYFNDVSMRIYEGQMKSELTYLETMLQYFDAEQRRLVANYKTEACSISREDSANWTCNIDPVAPELAIPLLPCNFIPINPNLLSDDEPMLHKEELIKQLEPYLLSLENVATAIMYACLVVMATVFIIHIIGLIFFHYMKASNRLAVHHIYVTTPLATNCGVDDNLPPPPPTEESDYESDEGFMQPRGGVSWRQAQTLPRGRHHIPHDQGMRTYPSPRSQDEKTPSLHCDFTYSETKV